jgi:Trypsin-like peptidase domain
MPSHALRLALAGALVSLALPATSALAASSGGLAGAQGSVVEVIKTAGNEKGAAFAIDDRGNFLTSQQVASRSAGLRVKVPGSSQAFPATRVESDAPPGLVLIHVDGGPRLQPLRFARSQARVGQRAWVAPPRPVSPELRRGAVRYPELLCAGNGDGVLTLDVARTAGLNGSPVLDAAGRVVGVVRTTRVVSDCTEAKTIQAVSATRAPQPLPSLAPPERSSFPAVPVVAIIFAVLIALNTLLYLRRRREAEPVIAFDDAPPPPASTGPRYADGLSDDDELEIALKPRS